MAFDDDLALKMLCQLHLHKYRTDERSKCKVAVFGSNDGFRCYRIDSLKKVSVKYYRFVVYTEMTDIDTLYAITATINYRAVGKLR